MIALFRFVFGRNGQIDFQIYTAG